MDKKDLKKKTEKSGKISGIDTTGLRTWIEVDTKALKHNYELFRKLIPKKTKLCAVAKSNAYGHGLVDYSKVMVGLGVDWLAVDSIVEGIRLREEGIEIPILVLGYTLPENFADAAKHDISISIASMDALRGALKVGGLKVHIKVDSGLHRQGFLLHQKEEVVKVITKNNKKNGIVIEGLLTHFASSANPDAVEENEAQIAIFKEWVDDFDEQGIACMSHIGDTGGATLYPHAHQDMVRIGIGFYGHWPDKTLGLKPALTWKSIISEIKDLPAGSRIGYNATMELHRNSSVAVVPVGYWHGFPRALSSIGTVFVSHHEAHVLGRVSMDMLVIDVTGVGAKIGDEVTLLGNESPLIDPQYVALLAETIPHELLTRLNPLIKKFYI